MLRAILLVVVVVLVLDLLWGSTVARGWRPPPGSDGASPYHHLERRSRLRTNPSRRRRRSRSRFVLRVNRSAERCPKAVPPLRFDGHASKSAKILLYPGETSPYRLELLARRNES